METKIYLLLMNNGIILSLLQMVIYLKSKVEFFISGKKGKLLKLDKLKLMDTSTSFSHGQLIDILLLLI